MDRDTKRIIWVGLGCISATIMFSRRHYFTPQQLIGLTIGGSVIGGGIAYSVERLQNN